MTKIIVLLGGISKEREVSINTGNCIYHALHDAGINVEKYMLNEDILDFINYLKINSKNIVIFNALHGKFGEDGRIQGLLDLMHIPYTHSGLLASALCMDKIITKNIATDLNISVAKDQVITLQKDHMDEIIINYPFVVKPINEGSSVGIYLVNSRAELEMALFKLSSFSVLMIEEYIEGIECTVGVLDGKALCVTEIISKNTFYDYEAKYVTGGSQHILPARIPIEVAEKMKQYSELLYCRLGARGVVRVDFIYSKEQDKIFLLEVNNQPGMTSTSLLPEQAEYMGMSFLDLCKKLISLADYDK